MDTTLTRKLANSALEDYDFGQGVTVEAINGWEYDSESSEVSCTVFLKFDDDELEDDSHIAHFNIEFDGDKVKCATCSYNGEVIGHTVA
ncbi:hypothetical protein GW796_00055 [archaeon]|nr:hypothetical protein [archaeon]